MTPWLPLGAYAAGVVSALVPWVNAEALLVSTIALTPASSSMTALIVVAVAAGQMTGKSAIYWMSRAGGRLSLTSTGHRRPVPRVPRWCDTWTASRSRTRGVILVSAVFCSTLLSRVGRRRRADGQLLAVLDDRARRPARALRRHRAAARALALVTFSSVTSVTGDLAVGFALSASPRCARAIAQIIVNIRPLCDSTAVVCLLH